MWAFSVLALSFVLRFSDAGDITTGEERLVIARAKMLVSTGRIPIKKLLSRWLFKGNRLKSVIESRGMMMDGRVLSHQFVFC